MAFNEQLADRVRNSLAHLKNVEPKMMFSGVAFLVNGKMCLNVIKEGLMCRVDPAIHEELVEKPGCNAMVMKGRELKGWVVVSEEVLKSKKDLEYWVSLALAFNDKAKSYRKKTIPPRRDRHK